MVQGGEAGMVDLLGIFRRRSAKRNSRGFARPRADITGSADGLGEMLASPQMMQRRLREGLEFFEFLRERRRVAR